MPIEPTSEIAAFAVEINGPERGDTDRFSIPDAFADDLRPLLAALDWSRVYNTSQAYGPLSQELAAAMRHARNLAESCEAFSKSSDDARASSGQD